LGKNDRPDVHFIRLSVFIVQTSSSARFYPLDAVLSADRFLLRPHAVKLYPHGRKPRPRKLMRAFALTRASSART
jgi:hypothetical protein